MCGNGGWVVPVALTIITFYSYNILNIHSSFGFLGLVLAMLGLCFALQFLKLLTSLERFVGEENALYLK